MPLDTNLSGPCHAAKPAVFRGILRCFLRNSKALVPAPGSSMWLSYVAELCLLFFLVKPVSGQDHSYRIFENFHGRFHCNGQWTEFDLKMSPVPGLLGIVD